VGRWTGQVLCTACRSSVIVDPDRQAHASSSGSRYQPGYGPYGIDMALGWHWLLAARCSGGPRLARVARVPTQWQQEHQQPVRQPERLQLTAATMARMVSSWHRHLSLTGLARRPQNGPNERNELPARPRPGQRAPAAPWARGESRATTSTGAHNKGVAGREVPSTVATAQRWVPRPSLAGTRTLGTPGKGASCHHL
jgi:hypothetical protein